MSGRLGKKDRLLTNRGARLNAINGNDEKMLARYYKSRNADYIDTVVGLDGISCRRQYFVDVDSFYCYIDSDNMKKGAELPKIDDDLELIERSDIYVKKGEVLASDSYTYRVTEISYNIANNVAKMTLEYISKHTSQ